MQIRTPDLWLRPFEQCLRHTANLLGNLFLLGAKASGNSEALQPGLIGPSG